MRKRLLKEDLGPEVIIRECIKRIKNVMQYIKDHPQLAVKKQDSYMRNAEDNELHTYIEDLNKFLTELNVYSTDYPVLGITSDPNDSKIEYIAGLSDEDRKKLVTGLENYRYFLHSTIAKFEKELQDRLSARKTQKALTQQKRDAYNKLINDEDITPEEYALAIEYEKELEQRQNELRERREEDFKELVLVAKNSIKDLLHDTKLIINSIQATVPYYSNSDMDALGLDDLSIRIIRKEMKTWKEQKSRYEDLIAGAKNRGFDATYKSKQSIEKQPEYYKLEGAIVQVKIDGSNLTDDIIKKLLDIIKQSNMQVSEGGYRITATEIVASTLAFGTAILELIRDKNPAIIPAGINISNPLGLEFPEPV